MPAQLEEVTLRFEYEVIRFDGSNVAILDCSPLNGEQQLKRLIASAGVRVKAECDPNELVSGLDYRFYGRWSNHEKYGRQFLAKTFVRVQPHGRRGVIRYLMQAPWIGQQYAKVLWDRFAGDSVRIVREQPDVASAAVGGQFNVDRATEASEFFLQEQSLESVTIDLMDLLDGRGCPKSTAQKAIKKWGNRAAEFIRVNPYLLMAFRGCGFLLCDKLYIDLGHNPDRLKRQALCAWYSIARNTSGDTWFPPKVVEQGIREKIGGTSIRDVDAARLSIRGGLLSSTRDDQGKLWLAERKKELAETRAAARVREWLSEGQPQWPAEDLGVSDHQREALRTALQSPLAVFTGGPGTGKTYSAARLIAQITKTHGHGTLAVCAPTGKAAVRISEALQEHGLKIRARTIHSLLEVEDQSEGDGWTFKHRAGNPLPYQFVIVDECSMIDTGLFCSLVEACGRDTHLLLVGDIGQLPPVGHGAPLRDLIDAGVPTGQLTEIRRNSGMIVKACHEMRAGKQFETCEDLNPSEGKNLKLLPAVKSATVLDKIVSTIKSVGERGIADPVWDCQVVVAVNEKSELSRKNINARLQLELNAGGKQVKPNPFRVDDKIVCLKNGFAPVVDRHDDQTVKNILKREGAVNTSAVDGKVFVANGEQAGVVFVEPRLTIALLESPPRLIKIPRGAGKGDDDGSTGCPWELAYAISCHKSQGSEWPIVFVVLDDYMGARMVCSREWLYTAVSRAKTACFLVGKMSTAFEMLGRQAVMQRKTFMKELICEDYNGT